VAFVEGSEARLHHFQHGQGPDIVWVSGGGGLAADWHPYQIPFFEREFRSTTFDNRGIGKTECAMPMPWPIEAFARDTADLIEAVCDPPVAIVGLSLGGAIVQQVAIDRPTSCAAASRWARARAAPAGDGTTRRPRSTGAGRAPGSTG
jgi:pimeloyl-ACP methyl ester carboxylesterase